MSEFEYNNLLFQISQRLDDINAGKQLLVICRGKLAARNEESIPTFALFEELEEKGFLSSDRLTVLKAILKGVKEWAFLEEVEKFACKRKEYNNLLEQIIRVLDELNDLERLISICRGNITEGRRASIHDVRSLFKELESNDCLGIECLEIVKEILTQTEKTDLLKEVEEFEQRQSRENKFERRKAQAAAIASSAIDKLAGVLNIKTVFKVVAGYFTIASSFDLLIRNSSYDQLITAVNTCVLPAGANLIQMTEGCVCLKVQVESLPALETLWCLYKDGTLKASLQALLVTDEIKELANGEHVEAVVTIDEQEYEKVRNKLANESQGPVVQREEWQEKVAYIQSYLAQTKDIDTQSFTTETSDSGISRSQEASSDLHEGTEELSDSTSNLCLKDLSKAVTAEITFRLQTDHTALEQFCQSVGLDRTKLYSSRERRQEIIELFPDTPVTLLRDVFKKLELYDLVELLEKVRPSKLRVLPAKEMDKLLNANKRPTKFFSKAEVLVMEYFNVAAEDKTYVERIESFFKDLNSKSQVTKISAEATFKQCYEDLRQLSKRRGLELANDQKAWHEETMLKELLREKVPDSRFTRGRNKTPTSDSNHEQQLLNTFKTYKDEPAMKKRLHELVAEREQRKLKREKLENDFKQKQEELQEELEREKKKFQIAFSTVVDKWIRETNDEDRESTLFVVIQLTDRNSLFVADEFIRTTQKFWAEKLGLISNTKLVITDIWCWRDFYEQETFQETLRVLINGRGALATMLEVLNKRWQTLDLISVFREIKRTLPVQYELFYQGDMDNWYSSRGHECDDIDDMLTCLPRLQKMDP